MATMRAYPITTETTADEVIMEGRNRRFALPGRRIASLIAVVLLVFTGGCDWLDSALAVDAPGLVRADDMSRPENAPVLVTGLIADFDCAFGAYVVNGGLLGNELRDASVTAARFSLDSRNIDDSSPFGVNACNLSPPGIYVPLATAIWTSNTALELLNGWTDAEVPNRANLLAQAGAYSGYAQLLMGEGFCSAVIQELGPEVPSQQAMQSAVARFTDAIAAATTANNASIRNMAQLGRARARLNLGLLADAAADARAVLASNPQFVRNADASMDDGFSRRWNRVTAEFNSGFITVEPSYHGLTVGGVPDTRVTVINTNTNGHDGATRVHVVAKYQENRLASNRARPLPIATWREAHLIIAEAERGQEAVDRINVLRAHHGLPAYAGGTDEEIMQQIIQERARELYLEGHHLNDLRRFNLPNTPETGTAYRQGGSYGSVRCFPIPAIERNNNPNF
jgi:starch-binding outer membrane protein, SusD/RagB family